MTKDQAIRIALEALEKDPSPLNAINNAKCFLYSALEQQYDQTALELCDVCGWKTLIPDDGCLNCERAKVEQEPVAWLDVDEDEAYSNSEIDEEAKKDLTPLYLAPPSPAKDLIVGYADSHDLTRDGHDFWVSRQPGKNTVPLYLYGRPPKIWQGLTEAEISEAEIWFVKGSHMLPYRFAREIERRLKEKNGG